MTTAVATAVDKKRAETLKAMTAETRKISEQIATKVSTVEAGRVLGAYNIGALLLPIKSNERDYGSNAVQQLADYHNISGGADALYRLMTFAETFDKEFVMAETRKPMANGTHMTVSHWVMLTRLSERSKVDKMLKRIFAESMSASDLEVEIRSGAAGSTKNVRAGGRKPNVPTNPVVGLQRTISLAVKFTRWDEWAAQSVCSAIDKMPADSVTEALQEKLEATLASVQEANTTAESMVKTLQANLARVKNVLSHRTAVSAKESSTDKSVDEAKQSKSAAKVATAKPATKVPAKTVLAKGKKKQKVKKKAAAV